jgi:hypothetical protein
MVSVAFIVIMLAISGCTERFKQHQLSQTPVFRPPVEAYARLLLLRETRKMLISQHEYQWLGYRFNLGVCYAGTIEDMPEEKWRVVITSACGELRQIQKAYPHPCGNDADQGCPIPENISLQLAEVRAELEAAAVSFASVESVDGKIPSTD